MSKEEKLLARRFCELSRTAFYRGIVTYSDFLDLNELNILHSLPRTDLAARYETFGGYGLSERQMAAFVPDALYCDADFPIAAMKISPLHEKYAEELTHRDYLGAILNLGISRSKTGDILVDGKEAVCFLHASLRDFFMQELSKVRHTLVKAEPADPASLQFRLRYEEIRGTVASVRLDSLLSLAFPASRTKMTAVIEAARVFVNGRLITSNGYQVKEGDVVSVRKMGKFKYVKMLSVTKKKRIGVLIHKYI